MKTLFVNPQPSASGWLSFLRVAFCWALFLSGSSLFFLVSAQAQSPGTAWTLRNPLPTNAYLYGSAWTGSQMVVVGHGGMVLTSPDGVAWTKRTSGTTASLSSVVWTGTQLAAVGDAGTILTSPDAVTWTKRTSGTTRNLLGIAWSGTQFIAVGEDGLALTSATGATWTARFTNTSADINAVTYTGTGIVAVGEFGVTLTSSNGISWTLASQTPAITFNSVAWSGSQLVGVTGNGTILTSPTGVVWTQQYASGSASFFGVGWSGGLGIAVGSGGTIVTSPDGLAWTVQTSGVSTFLFGIVQAGAQSLVVGAGGTLLTSPDGVAWTPRSMISSKSLRDVAWTGISILAVGEAGTVLSSTTGATWNVESSGSIADLEAITWAGTQVVAVGSGGTILTSPDGITWTSRVSGTAQRLLGITWTRSLLVAVGANGTILTSPDGITWTAQASGTIADLRGITWTGGQLVAVGVGGTVSTSVTGTGWTTNTVAPFADLSEVTWTGTQLVAVGDGDTVITSPTGSSWTLRTLAFSQNLLGIASTGSLLTAVGTSQTILTSPTGTTWTSVSTASPKLPQLNSVEWIGTQLVAVGDGGTIMTSGTPSPPTPVVSFNLVSSTVAESVGTVTLGVNLSIAPLTSVTIPFISSGTATPNADYTATVSPITFAAGQSAKSIIITVKNDVLVESSEALTIAIGNPAKALIGGNNSFALTISDNDIAPVVVTDPVSQIVEVGEAVTSFTTLATGSPTLSYQWRKNGVDIALATGSTYSIFNAQLANAGKYTALAKNPTATDLSGIAELAVVNTAVTNLQVPITKTATMTIATAGNGLTYLWKKNNVGMTNGGRISGVTTKTLVIDSLVSPDTDVYTCDVTGPGGTITGGDNNLTVLLPPVVTPPAFPSTMTSGLYSHALNASNFPTLFTVTGLPSGMVCNAATGIVSGRAIVSGNYVVRIAASNAAGTSPTISATLIVQPLPLGSVGNFAGTVGREATVNASLGGRIAISTTAAGSYSGTLVLAAKSYAFKGVLDTSFNASPQGTLSIPRTSGSPLQLAFTINAMTNTLAGSLGTGGPLAAVTAWRNVWHATANPAATRVGYYTFSLEIPIGDIGNVAIPQGNGFGSFSTALDGSLTVSGRLADGSSFATSTFMGPSGEFLVYQPTFANAGSVLGTLTVTPDIASSYTDNSVAGTLTWGRIVAAAPSVRTYSAAFGPINLSAYGKYLAAVKGQLILGLPSDVSAPAMLFAEGGLASALINPDVPAFTYTAANTVIMPTPGSLANPGRATLSISTQTGDITGSFTLVDLAVTRQVSYTGVIVRPVSGPLKAVGYFLLPQLPLLNNTSPILSGQMVIQQ